MLSLSWSCEVYILINLYSIYRWDRKAVSWVSLIASLRRAFSRFNSSLLILNSSDFLLMSLII